MKIITRQLFLWGLVLASAIAQGAPSLLVNDAYVRAPLPGRNETVAYLSVHNVSAETRELVGVSSPSAQRVEIHESRHKDGMMQMRPVAALTLVPQQHLEFAPGGLHLMLMGLKLPLPEMVELSFHLAGGERIHVRAKLKTL